jgi:hypothetical protein
VRLSARESKRAARRVLLPRAPRKTAGSTDVRTPVGWACPGVRRRMQRLHAEPLSAGTGLMWPSGHGYKWVGDGAPLGARGRAGRAAGVAAARAPGPRTAGIDRLRAPAPRGGRACRAGGGVNSMRSGSRPAGAARAGCSVEPKSGGRGAREGRRAKGQRAPRASRLAARGGEGRAARPAGSGGTTVFRALWESAALRRTARARGAARARARKGERRSAGLPPRGARGAGLPGGRRAWPTAPQGACLGQRGGCAQARRLAVLCGPFSARS